MKLYTEKMDKELLGEEMKVLNECVKKLQRKQHQRKRHKVQHVNAIC